MQILAETTNYMQLADINCPTSVFGRGQVRQDPEDRKPALRAVETPSAAHGAGGGAFDDELDLVARSATGDGNAFRVLVDRHLAVVVAGARRILNDDSEAEDVAQEAFVRLWGAAATLDIGAHGVRPWLRRVSRNLAIDRLRVARRFDLVDEVPDEGQAGGQERQVAASDRADRVQVVLSSLPDRQRAALSLFHYEDLTQAEIAEQLSCSVDAVESLLARARRRLKQTLRHEWHELLDDGDTG